MSNFKEIHDIQNLKNLKQRIAYMPFEQFRTEFPQFENKFRFNAALDLREREIKSIQQESLSFANNKSDHIRLIEELTGTIVKYRISENMNLSQVDDFSGDNVLNPTKRSIVLLNELIKNIESYDNIPETGLKIFTIFLTFRFYTKSSRSGLSELSQVKDEFSMLTQDSLKLRVEVVTDFYLDIFSIKEKQDIELFKTLKVPSHRTPDIVFERSGKIAIVETNYSSSSGKGYYSKGFDVSSSKYYEEMYYSKTRQDVDIYHYPIIFYHGIFDDLSNSSDGFFFR